MEEGWLRRRPGIRLSKVNTSMFLFGLTLVLVAVIGAQADIDGVQIGKGASWWVQPILLASGAVTIALALIVNQGPNQGRRVGHGFLSVPPRKPNRLVSRPDLLDAVVTTLSARRPCIALTGIGGAGKSTLAKQVCGNRDVQRLFRDGVAWIEARPVQEPVALLAELASQLHVPEPDCRFTTVSEGRNKVAAALGGKQVLVALDNVAARGQVDAFMGLAPNCAVLFTTRLPESATTFDAAQIHVDELTQEQALDLLDQWTGSVTAKPSSDARKLCTRVGNLALGISMAGAMVAQGRSFADVLALIERDLSRLRADLDPEYPYRTMFAAIEAGISDLPEDDQRRYALLAVFSRRGPFPRAAACALWQSVLSDAEASDLLVELTGRSLLTSPDDGWYAAHDVQSEVLARRIGPDGLAAAHRQLLDGYRIRHPTGWTQTADDPYMSAAVATHLRGAGNDDELQDLLVDARWIAGRLAAGQLPGLISDYELTENPLCREIARAIRLSAHVLAADPGLVRSQLAGRLQGHPDHLVAEWADALALSDEGESYLVSVSPALTPTTAALRQILAGHSRKVMAVAVSTDGETAVSGGTDGSVRAWNLATGRVRVVMPGQDGGAVSSLALTADAVTAASGSADGTIRIWSLDSGKLQGSLPGHAGAVSSLAIAQDGTTMVSGGDDATIRLWDVQARHERVQLTGHTDGVRSVAITMDGKHAISGSRDGSIRVWDLAAECETAMLTGHDGPVLAVGVSADGQLAVSGGGDGSVRIWDLADSRQTAILTGHTGGVMSVSVSEDGRIAASAGSDDGTVRIWDLRDRRQAAVLTGHDGWVRSVAISSDGSLAVSGGSDGAVRVWDLADDDNPPAAAASDNGPVWAVAIAPDAAVAAIGGASGSMRIWDLIAGREKTRLVGTDNGAVSSIAITPDGTALLSGSGAGSVLIWDPADQREQAILGDHDGWAWSVVAVAADGTIAVSGCGDGTLRVWDLAAQKEKAVLTGHKSAVSVVAVTPGGELAVSGGDDGTVRAWDLATREEIAVLTGHDDWVLSLALTADGKLAVSGGDDGTVRLWDLTTRCELAVLARHNRPVRSVAIAADGTLAVSGCDNGSVRVFEISTRAEIARWTGDYAVLACAVLEGLPVRIGVGQRCGQPYLLEIRGRTAPDR
jgi:WD40 repeat protein